MLFGDFEEDFSPNAAIGKDDHLKVNSSTDESKNQNNSSLKLLERIASEYIAFMSKKSYLLELRNNFCCIPCLI